MIQKQNLPPLKAEGEVERTWKTQAELWKKLKPLARQMRSEPTAAENRLWQRLRNKQILGYKFRRQHAIDRFIVDFICNQALLVIEVDGEIHDYTQEEDAIRQEFLESQGLRVIRFRNQEVLGNIDGVVEEIARWLEPHPPALTGVGFLQMYLKSYFFVASEIKIFTLAFY
jgi:very-short-patch-repair endonuclease